MKLQPLKQWVCDSCGEFIMKPEDGWWEFFHNTKTDLISEFRIVHHENRCMADELALRRKNISVGSMSLDHMVTSGAFGHMLHWLELTETKKLSEHFKMIAFIEIMRRLYLPYWEEARLYWEEAFRDGFHDACGFSKKDLLSIIEEYGKGRPIE